MHQFERANDAAENAMLKTLEEPPASTSLILTTENPRQLRATVLSRCWHLQLVPAPQSAIAPWLKQRVFPMLPGRKSSWPCAPVWGDRARPGANWSGCKTPRPAGRAFRSASDLLGRIEVALPVGALGLTEEALKWAKVWWDEDAGDEADSKKLGAKGNRAAAARFLDELMIAARARWMNEAAQSANGAARLDQIRATRGYILGNANLNLALDVMFGRLIALRSSVPNGARGAMN